MVHAVEGADVPRGMTHEELLTLSVSFPLDVANRALGLGRTTGFALAKQGVYPVRVLRLGSAVPGDAVRPAAVPRSRRGRHHGSGSRRGLTCTPWSRTTAPVSLGSDGGAAGMASVGRCEGPNEAASKT